MASRVRYIIRAGGNYYIGSDARVRLEQITGLPMKSREAVVAAAKLLNLPVWVFREPRRIAYERSRYKGICHYFGIGKAKRKPKPAVAENAVFDPDYILDAPPQIHWNKPQLGVQHGANQPAGLANQIEGLAAKLQQEAKQLEKKQGKPAI